MAFPWKIKHRFPYDPAVPFLGMLQEGGPLPSPKLGSCLTLGNELSEETHVLTKQEILLGKGTRVESSRVREPRRTALKREFLKAVRENQLVTYKLLLLLSRFSRVRFCATPWTAAYQAPPSMGFSRQQYWSGVPLPSPNISW